MIRSLVDCCFKYFDFVDISDEEDEFDKLSDQLNEQLRITDEKEDLEREQLIKERLRMEQLVLEQLKMEQLEQEVYAITSMAGNMLSAGKKTWLTEDKYFFSHAMTTALRLVVIQRCNAAGQCKSSTIKRLDLGTGNEVLTVLTNVENQVPEVQEKQVLKCGNKPLNDACALKGNIEWFYNTLGPYKRFNIASKLIQRDTALQFYFHYVQTGDVLQSCSKVRYPLTAFQDMRAFIMKVQRSRADIAELIAEISDVQKSSTIEKRDEVMAQKYARLQQIRSQFKELQVYFLKLKDYPFREFHKQLDPRKLVHEVYVVLTNFLILNPHQPEAKLCLRRLRYKKRLSF